MTDMTTKKEADKKSIAGALADFAHKHEGKFTSISCYPDGYCVCVLKNGTKIDGNIEKVLKIIASLPQ